MIRQTDASDLSLLRKSQAGGPELPRSEVLHDGEPTGTFVAGLVLEAAFSCDSNRLLFTTDDVPFEDFLGIHLLDSSLSLLDSAKIGWPYATGTFSVLDVEDRSIVFRFLSEVPWRLRLLDGPQLRLPIFTEPCYVWRPFGFTRRFVLTQARDA
jgi:hypothetical protein